MVIQGIGKQGAGRGGRGDNELISCQGPCTWKGLAFAHQTLPQQAAELVNLTFIST